MIRINNTTEEIRFFEACRTGNLKKIKILLKKDSDLVFSKNHNDVTGLMMACLQGDIEIVKYLLTSPELSKHADILHKSTKNTSLHYACISGNLEVVEFLTTSTELNIHATVDNNTLYCSMPFLNIIEFLLSDKRLTHHANPYDINDCGRNFFSYITSGLDQTVNNTLNYQILEYLLFDYNLVISDEDKSKVTNKKVLSMLDYQQKKLESIELYEQLDSHLHNKKMINKNKL